MYKKDYFLKLIEEFARALAKILRLKQEGETEKALEAIRATYDKILAADYNQIHSSSIPELIKNLDELSLDKLEMAGDLLKVEGEIRLNEGNFDKANELFKKAFYLFQYVDKNRNIYSFELQDKIRTTAYFLSES